MNVTLVFVCMKDIQYAAVRSSSYTLNNFFSDYFESRMDFCRAIDFPYDAAIEQLNENSTKLDRV